MCAGLAVNAGLEQEEAWKAITIYPARYTGIADRVGSLTAGKDGDVVIWEGNPLRDLWSHPAYVFVDGKLAHQA
jgi:imidazolonepropionase-like amidohydrolase